MKTHKFYAAFIVAFCLLATTVVCYADGAAQYDPSVMLGKGKHVVAMIKDADGKIWAGTQQGEGLYCYNPSAPTGQQWQQYGVKDGLGDEDIMALACDKLGRIWAGHMSHGVSVYNGKSWKNYDVLTGPIGERVFDIEVCPTDGDVWIATSAGLSRYSIKGDSWSYYTRADGLPSDQISAIAFDKAGNIYAGTQCDGLAISGPVTGYKRWTTATAPFRFGTNKESPVPLTAKGDGLPSNQINDVFAAKDGTIYVGTKCGLAWQKPQSSQWQYIRGRNYVAKVKGIFGGAPKDWKEPDKDSAELKNLPADDEIMCIAQDAAGMIWLGHKVRGYSVIDPQKMELKYSWFDELLKKEKAQNKRVERREDNFVKAILTTAGNLPWISIFNTTRESVRLADVSYSDKNDVPAPQPTSQNADVPHPSIAKQPAIAELQAIGRKMAAIKTPWPTEGGMYLGEDWTTQGDWVGRYGRMCAVLAASNSPDNHYFSGGGNITLTTITAKTGPNATADESLRHWCGEISSDNRRILYDPQIALRRVSEWDDHGEVYPLEQDGPNIWIKIDVPDKGIYRVTVKFPPGIGSKPRDYFLELRPYIDDIKKAEMSDKVYARTRVASFGDGVYKSFAVVGGTPYHIKVSRNNTYNTIVSAVMIDRLDDVQAYFYYDTRFWLAFADYRPGRTGKKRYNYGSGTTSQPSTQLVYVPEKATLSDNLKAANELWSSADESYKWPSSIASQKLARCLAYRVAVNEKADSKLLATWRWLQLYWTPEDRKEFEEVMAEAWWKIQKSCPDMRTKKYRQYSPFTYDTPEEWEQKHGNEREDRD